MPSEGNSIFGLLVKLIPHQALIHNWHKRQADNVFQRLSRYLSRYANDSKADSAHNSSQKYVSTQVVRGIPTNHEQPSVVSRRQHKKPKTKNKTRKQERKKGGIKKETTRKLSRNWAPWASFRAPGQAPWLRAHSCEQASGSWLSRPQAHEPMSP